MDRRAGPWHGGGGGGGGVHGDSNRKRLGIASTHIDTHFLPLPVFKFVLNLWWLMTGAVYPGLRVGQVKPTLGRLAADIRV